MFLSLQCIKGEAGASGIPGVDGREGHPVSRKYRHYSLNCLVFCRLFKLLLLSYCMSLLGLAEIEDSMQIVHD